MKTVIINFVINRGRCLSYMHFIRLDFMWIVHERKKYLDSAYLFKFDWSGIQKGNDAYL